MRLSGVCVLVSAIWAAIGLVPALWMQAELWAPGIQFAEPRLAGQVFSLARDVHAPVFSIALPLTLVAALGAALYAEREESGLWRGVAVIYLIIAGLAVLGAALSPQVGANGVLRDLAGLAVISGAVLGLVLAARASKRVRMSAVLFGICGALAMLVAGVLGMALTQLGDDSALADTAFVTAQAHAIGVGLTLWAMAVLTVMIGRGRASASGGISLMLAILMLGSGLAMVWAQASVGMRGMPRGYVDYPAVFAPLQLLASVGAVLFTLTTVMALLRLAVIARVPRERVSDAFA